MAASSQSSPASQARSRQRAADVPDASFATTLARGLDLLSAFRAGDGALSNAELAARTGLSRPTVSRLTGTLAELGYLSRGSNGRYRLGLRVLSTAYPLLAGLRVRQLARPLMRDVASAAGGIVSIAMPFELDFIYIETVRTTDASPHVPDVGFSAPLAATAVGRAILSMYDESEFQHYCEAMQASRPQEWARLHENLQNGIEMCRTQGFCTSLGEWRPEMYGVAAPLYRTSDGECLAVNCGIPSFRVSVDEVMRDWGPRIAGLAHGIRSIVGGAESAEPVANNKMERRQT